MLKLSYNPAPAACGKPCYPAWAWQKANQTRDAPERLGSGRRRSGQSTLTCRRGSAAPRVTLHVRQDALIRTSWTICTPQRGNARMRALLRPESVSGKTARARPGLPAQSNGNASAPVEVQTGGNLEPQRRHAFAGQPSHSHPRSDAWWVSVTRATPRPRPLAQFGSGRGSVAAGIEHAT